jgi:hypothetical protein
VKIADGFREPKDTDQRDHHGRPIMENATPASRTWQSAAPGADSTSVVCNGSRVTPEPPREHSLLRSIGPGPGGLSDDVADRTPGETVAPQTAPIEQIKAARSPSPRARAPRGAVLVVRHPIGGVTERSGAVGRSRNRCTTASWCPRHKRQPGRGQGARYPRSYTGGTARGGFVAAVQRGFSGLR